MKKKIKIKNGKYFSELTDEQRLQMAAFYHHEIEETLDKLLQVSKIFKEIQNDYAETFNKP